MHLGAVGVGFVVRAGRAPVLVELIYVIAPFKQ